MNEPIVSKIQEVRQLFENLALTYKGIAIRDGVAHQAQAAFEHLIDHLVRCKVIADLEYSVFVTVNVNERTLYVKVVPDMVVYE